MHAAIGAAREIRALGGDVMFVRADVADEGEMRAALAQVCERFGPPDGIIHAAGILGQGLISKKSVSDVKRILDPKAVGVLVLDKILREPSIEPDFVLLCSSLHRYTDYRPARVLCRQRISRRLCLISCQHGEDGRALSKLGLRQELGMIEQAEMAPETKATDHRRDQGQGPVTAGIEVFRRILENLPAPQVLISPDPLESLLSTDALAQAEPPALPSPGSSPHSHPLIINHPWLAIGAAEDSELKSYVSHLDARQWVSIRHRPSGKIILPGTAYLELARAALATHDPNKPVQLSNVYFLTPLLFQDGQSKEIRTILKRRNGASSS